MEILKCKEVRKIYGSGDSQVIALDSVDLSVEKGEFTAIVGASGSGKSTLLHILGTVDRPTKGSVWIDGTDISAMNPTQAAIFRRRKIGLVYQFYNLIPTLTIRKNILMPLLLDKKKPTLEYFETVIHTLGIEDKLEALPQPAVRRPAAEGCHRQIPDLPSGDSAGRRTHRKSGSEKFKRNYGYAEAVQPQSEADRSAGYP